MMQSTRKVLQTSLSAIGQISPRRTIFGAEYIGVNHFQEERRNFIQERSPARLKPSRSRALTLASEEPQKLLSDDVRRVLYTSQSAKDANDAAKILKIFVERAGKRR